MRNEATTIEGILDNLRRIFQVINEQSKKIEKQTGVTGPQLWALKVIHNKSAIVVKDIAAKMYLNAATVVGILDRMEEKKLVLRKRDKKDKRFVRLSLTNTGEKIVQNAPEVAQDRIISGLEKLSKTKLNYISGGLEQLVKILDAQELPPKLLFSNEVNVPSRKRRVSAKK